MLRRTPTFQLMLGDENHVASVMRERAGHAFDPAIAGLVADDARNDLGV